MGATLDSVQASLKEDSTPIKVKLESFSGYEHQDVNRWLQNFDNRLALRRKPVDPKTAAADFTFHLAGPAESWYYSLDESVRIDIKASREALLKRFCNPHLEWRLLQQLSSRRQDEKESLDSYVDFITSTCQRLHISDSDKLHYFVQGLHEDIKRAVLMKTPKTFEEDESVTRLQVSVESALSPWGGARHQLGLDEGPVLLLILGTTQKQQRQRHPLLPVRPPLRGNQWQWQHRR